MSNVAEELAGWVIALEPTADDLELAQRALVDTVAVALAGRDHPVNDFTREMSEGARWAVAGHVLDFDDLHMESTTHVSVVCVPATLVSGGSARAYLAAAGVMSRLGNVLGWCHYVKGWHSTCTAGAAASAVAGAVAMSLNEREIANAIALAIPGSGGVQRAFGTDAKSLQIGFAVETGLRAAYLAAAGADADPTAVDAWLELVGATHSGLSPRNDAVPDGLAIKLYPACYALQRPIAAISSLAVDGLDPAQVDRVVLSTPAATVAPLIHHRPETGLQAKFSIEYAAATALLDRHQGFDAFTDAAVRRPEAQRIIEKVELELSAGGNWLLDGELHVEVHLRTGDILRTAMKHPPGSPLLPPTATQLAAKLNDCIRGLDVTYSDWTWENAADVLRAHV